MGLCPKPRGRLGRSPEGDFSVEARRSSFSYVVPWGLPLNGALPQTPRPFGRSPEGEIFNPTGLAGRQKATVWWARNEASTGRLLCPENG